MPVLKAQTFNPARKDAVVLDLGDLGRQAAKLRQIAETKAEAVLSAAHAEAARLTQGAAEQGDQRGYAEGLERGLAEGRQQGRDEARQSHDETLKRLAGQWNETLAQFEQARTEYFREARSATLRLAVTLAGKVVHRAAETDAEVALDQAAAALSRVLEPAAVKLRCCPEDAAILEEAVPEMVARFANITGIELIPDEAVSPGGCVVACGLGRIDATVETQLDRLTELLLGGADSEPDAPDSDE